MNPQDRYTGEPLAPQAPTVAETLRYWFEQVSRRSHLSAQGLTDAELSVDPGQGAMTIGQLLAHELNLLRSMVECLKPGATADLPNPNIGQAGAWNLAAIVERREALAERFRVVLAAIEPAELMEKRPQLPPPKWAELPVLARVLRPLIDYGHHVGQVTYARRQLGHPVGK